MISSGECGILYTEANVVIIIGAGSPFVMRT
jgi:hypothetical protein